VDDDGAVRPGAARRRRRRATRAQGAPAPSAAAEAGSASEPVKPLRKRAQRDAPAERGLRDIVGAGRSQLGVSGALRGRDLNRPTAEDLAAAEQEVVIVRRNWKPPERRS
jgi:hypothetical protein